MPTVKGKETVPKAPASKEPFSISVHQQLWTKNGLKVLHLEKNRTHGWVVFVTLSGLGLAEANWHEMLDRSERRFNLSPCPKGLARFIHKKAEPIFNALRANFNGGYRLDPSNILIPMMEEGGHVNPSCLRFETKKAEDPKAAKEPQFVGAFLGQGTIREIGLLSVAAFLAA